MTAKWYCEGVCERETRGTNVSTLGYRKSRVIFCVFDIGQFPWCIQVTVCTLGVFVLFIAYGYIQELIFRLEGFKPYGFYLTLIQFSIYAMLAQFERRVRRDIVRRAPFRIHLLLSLLSIGTIGFSNASVGYLNYPTQVVFKCCKLIPVLVGGIVIQGKKYGVLDFLAALTMSAGLAAFVLTDSRVSPSFALLGLWLVSFSLLMDACVGNVQEMVMNTYHVSEIEIMFYSYSMGSLWLVASLLLSRQLIPAVEFCSQHPVETYGYGALFSLAGYFGLQLVLTLVRTTGAFVAAMITTCRKVATVVLSFVLFSKPFSFQYVWSGLIVLLGVYLHTLNKVHSAERERPPPPLSTRAVSHV